jgi:hypothetical protein
MLPDNRENAGLRSECLLRFYLWDGTVSVVIRVVKIDKCVVIRRALDSYIIDPKLFVPLQVVLHNHPARSDHGHFAHSAVRANCSGWRRIAYAGM